MKLYKKIYVIVLLLGLLFVYSSCTKMDEEVYSKLRSDQFFTSEADVIAAMAPVYSSFRPWLDWQSWWDIEESTDVAVTPIRSFAWYDGGIYQRMHKHTWTAYDPHFRGIWNMMYNNINNCNRVISQLQNATFEVNGKDSYIAELRTARAYIYYQLCSLYGNVPIVDKYDVPEGYMPETKSRKEVFDFIVKELNESIPNLSETNGGQLYGRFNKWAALTILARMYINSQAWVGIPMWNECIAVCDQIISSNKYSLEGNFKTNYALNNNVSKEIIFAWPYDEKYSGGQIYIAFRKTLTNENLVKTYLAKTWADDGVMAVPSFVNTFSATDKRLAGTFVMGQQYGADGTPLKCTGLVPTDAGKPLIYTNTLGDVENAGEAEGYRFGKFEIKMGTMGTCDNDWPAMRYAEVLYMKAECLLRSDGDAYEAAILVNQVRERAFDTPEPITATDLLATTMVNEVATPYGRMLSEWGWEFAIEVLRREQLIRFDNYTQGTWTAHSPSQDFRKLFPIPDNTLSSNSNLTQNPGY